MRVLAEIKMSTERFNQALREGTADKTMQGILADIKPEAAYFCARDGQRCVVLVLDLASPSQIPALAEPWFLQFDADVAIQPLMAREDLQQAGLDQLAKKWA